MMQNGNVGELYPAGDSYALTSKIITIHNEFVNYIKNADNARIVSLRRNCTDNVVKELCQVYHNVMLIK